MPWFVSKVGRKIDKLLIKRDVSSLMNFMIYIELNIFKILNLKNAANMRTLAVFQIRNHMSFERLNLNLMVTNC